jgi:hypothetical protein
MPEGMRESVKGREWPQNDRPCREGRSGCIPVTYGTA